MSFRIPPLNLKKTQTSTTILLRAPVDILQSITAFLDGKSISRLLTCGNKQLFVSLGERGGVTSFRLHLHFSGKLPPGSLFSNLPKLRAIVICMKGNLRQDSLTAIEPAKFPSTIVKIHFDFKWAEWIWKSLSTHTLLDSTLVFKNDLEKDAASEIQVARLIPALQYLHLDGWPALKDAFVVHLPLSMTHFGLSNNTFLTPACIDYLPGHLLTLELPSVTSWSDEDLARLPRTLTHLNFCGCANRLDSSCFAYLPRTLETLTLGTIKVNPEDVPHLPPGLLRLSFNVLKHKSAPHSSSWLGLLPTSLANLKLRFQKEALFTDPCLALLPRNLTHLDINSSLISDHGLADLPPHLRFLRIESACNLTPNVMSVLPKPLQVLQVPSTLRLGPLDVPKDRPHLVVENS